jgi:transcriptional regulator with XRE-family HTH domain
MCASIVPFNSNNGRTRNGDKVRIHNNLASLIKNRGLKDKDLAATAKIPPSQVSEGINGKRVFSDQQLERICSALGVTVEQIYPDDSMRKALAE